MLGLKLEEGDIWRIEEDVMRTKNFGIGEGRSQKMLEWERFRIEDRREERGRRNARANFGMERKSEKTWNISKF